MLTRELSNTGVMVPEIGAGTSEYRGGPEPLRHAVELGAFLIDTAELYGTEGQVGEAIRGIRDKVFVATKVSSDNLRYKDVLRAADNSLKRLGIDQIDLYQVHWPNPSVPIDETMSAMEALVEERKVRFIGVSNFSIREMEGAQKAMSKHRIVANQVLYNLVDREIEKDVLPYCQQHQITVLAYSPFAKGALLRPPAQGRTQGARTVQQVAQATGKTAAQVVLNWCLSRPGVIAIPKSDSISRWEENCGASGWQLTVEQVRLLEQAFA